MREFVLRNTQGQQIGRVNADSFEKIHTNITTCIVFSVLGETVLTIITKHFGEITENVEPRIPENIAGELPGDNERSRVASA